MDQKSGTTPTSKTVESNEHKKTQREETLSDEVYLSPEIEQKNRSVAASGIERKGVFRAAGIWCISGPGVALAQWLQAAAVIGAAITLVYSDVSLKQQRTEFTLRYAAEFNETHLSDLAVFRETLPAGVSSVEALDATQMVQARELIQDRAPEASRVLLFLSGFIDCYESGLCNKSLTQKTLCQPTEFYKTRVLDFLLENEQPSQAGKISNFLSNAC